MKRIGLLVVTLVAVGTGSLFAQEAPVSFSFAATAAEQQAEGVVLSVGLIDMLGESVYVVHTSAGETVVVNAFTGAAEAVESTDERGDRQKGGRGGPLFGSLLTAVGADIDFDALVAAASEETGRNDARAATLRRSDETVVAHVFFGDRTPEASEEAEPTERLIAVVDVESSEVVEVHSEAGRGGPARRGPSRNEDRRGEPRGSGRGPQRR